MDAWEPADVERIRALLTDDCVLAMPPWIEWFSGRDAVMEFLPRGPLQPGHRWKLVPTRANGQPAFGCYYADRTAPSGPKGSSCSASARTAGSARSPPSATGALPKFGLPLAMDWRAPRIYLIKRVAPFGALAQRRMGRPQMEGDPMSPVTDKTKKSIAWVVVLTGIGSFMGALDTLVVSTALPTIRLDLGASVSGLEWTVNAYNLSFAVMLITGGRARRSLRAAAALCPGWSDSRSRPPASALAPSVGALIVARALQGVGRAFVLSLGLALLSAAFPAEKRGTAIGLFSAVTGLAVASGPARRRRRVNGLDWSWIFWLNVPIGLIAASRSSSPACARATGRTAHSTSPDSA